MEIKFYQHQTEISDQTKAYIEEKVQKLCKYINNDSVTTEVEIEKQNNSLYRVEVQVRIPGARYIGDEVAQSPEAACDLVSDELASQIKRDKGKRKTLQKRGELSIKKNLSIDQSARFN